MLLYTSISTILIALGLIIQNFKINRHAVLLGAALICLSWYGIVHYMVVYSKWPTAIAVFYNHFTPLSLCAGPFLYLYVRGSVRDDTRFYKHDLLHFIPALIQLIGIFPWICIPWNEKLYLSQVISENVDVLYRMKTNLFYPTGISVLLRSVTIVLYCLLSLQVIFSYNISEYKINKVPQEQLLIFFRWLNIGLTLVFVMMLLFTFYLIDAINTSPSLALENSKFLNQICGLVFIGLAIVPLLYRSVLYGLPQYNSPEESGTVKFEMPALSLAYVTYLEECEPNPFTALAKQLLYYIDSSESFLHADYSIQSCATDLKVPTLHIDYCITQLLKTSFEELIKTYRIEYAKKKIGSLQNRSIKLSDLATQSGFASVKAFNHAFTSYTGISPQNYTASLHHKLD